MKLREWQKIVLIIVVSLLLMAVMVNFLAGRLARVEVSVSEETYLDIVLSGPYPERTAEDPVLEALGEAVPHSLQDVLQVIRKAQRDDRIRAIILRPMALAVGWAKLERFATP